MIIIRLFSYFYHHPNRHKSPLIKYSVNYFLLQVVRPSSTVQLKSRIISSCPPSSQRLSIWSARWLMTPRSKCSKEPGAFQYHPSGPDVSVTADYVWTDVISCFSMYRRCLAVQWTICGFSFWRFCFLCVSSCPQGDIYAPLSIIQHISQPPGTTRSFILIGRNFSQWHCSTEQGTAYNMFTQQISCFLWLHTLMEWFNGFNLNPKNQCFPMNHIVIWSIFS